MQENLGTNNIVPKPQMAQTYLGSSWCIYMLLYIGDQMSVI